MPNFWDAPDIIPLPSLQAYSSLSFIFFSYSLYYAFQITSNPNWKTLQDVYVPSSAELNSTSLAQNGSLVLEEHSFHSNIFTDFLNRHNSTFPFNNLVESNVYFARLVDIAAIMFKQPLCVWTLINMGYCLLILLGKVIQKLIFGDLRASEQQLIREGLWNFLFDKFIFVFSVINVQYMDELILWCAWFSILGFMFLLTHLCKERFNYLAFSPAVSKWIHVRLLALLSIILVSSIPLFTIGTLVAYHHSFSIGVFLLSECTLLILRALYCVFLYFIHLWDINTESIWERRASVAYYVELVFDLLILSIDFGHHLHMLFWGNIIVSLSSLVIIFQVRSIFGAIRKRIKKHRNYLEVSYDRLKENQNNNWMLKVLNMMENNFPIASREELENNNDDCAICWDSMATARKLPCGHLFHTTCLRSWLEQDTSCPTCRLSLRYREAANADVAVNNENNLPRALLNVGNVNFRFNNHFFHFDGPRYSRWLPRVSVELTAPNVIDININTVRNNLNANIDRTELEYMGQQVLEWFPQISLPVVLEDLQSTGSVELTIENILDGRVHFTPTQVNDQASTSEVSFDAPSTSAFHDQPSTSATSIEQPQPSSSSSSSIIQTEKEERKVEDVEPPDLENRFLQLSPNERLKLRMKRKEEMFNKAKTEFQKQD